MPPIEPFRGVSLGGWLVFESFLTVSVDVVCEAMFITFCSSQLIQFDCRFSPSQIILSSAISLHADRMRYQWQLLRYYNRRPSRQCYLLRDQPKHHQARKWEHQELQAPRSLSRRYVDVDELLPFQGNGKGISQASLGYVGYRR